MGARIVVSEVGDVGVDRVVGDEVINDGEYGGERRFGVHLGILTA